MNTTNAYQIFWGFHFGEEISLEHCFIKVPFAEKYPMINNLMLKIQTKKRKDAIIMAGVISACLIFTIWYVIAWTTHSFSPLPIILPHIRSVSRKYWGFKFNVFFSVSFLDPLIFENVKFKLFAILFISFLFKEASNDDFIFLIFFRDLHRNIIY